MKRAICVVCILASLFCNTSCYFVSYIPEGQDIISEDSLYAVKLEYIQNLQKTFENCDYSEEERAQVRYLLQDAANEINECNSYEDIILAYDKHFKLIKAVNEDAYNKSTPSLYRTYLLKQVDDSIVWDDYLDEAKEQINVIIANYTILMDEADTFAQLDEFVTQLRVALYQVPTKVQLAQEATELKAKHNVLLKMYLQECIVQSQKEAITNVIGTYNSKAAQIEYDKAALIDLLSECEEEIKKINADIMIDYKGLNKEIDDLFEQLVIAINSAEFLSEHQKADWIEQANNAKSEMKAKDSLGEIRDIYFSYMKSLYREQDMSRYIAVLLDELQMYKSDQFYYTDDQIVVDSLKSNLKASISNANDYVAADEALAVAKNQINQTKTIAEAWDDVLNEFRRKLNEQYSTNVLTEPSSMMYAQNYYELAEIIDYYAFYQMNTNTPSFVCDKFMVELGFPHDSATETVNIVYWYSELIKTAVGISGYFEGDDYLVIQLKPYNLAFYSNRDNYPINTRLESDIDYDSDHSSMVERNYTFDNFSYYQNTKQLEGVWNTQQLWYALEYGYVPICIPGSAAEKTLNRAKDILREIICEGMTDEEKIFRIYTWFGQNVQYDRQYYSYNTGLEDEINYPDEKIAEMICFQAEGALLENLSVCYSFAKAYLILLRIEGIEAYFCISRSYYDNQKNDVIATTHAFVKIKLDGKWYTSDPQRSSLEGDIELPSYLRFLIPVNNLEHIVYTHKDIDMSESGDYSIYDKLLLNGKKVFVDNLDDIKALINEIKEGHTVSFLVPKELCKDVEALLAKYPQYQSKRNKTYDYNNTEIAEYYVYE